MDPTTHRVRRRDGWGFADETFEPSPRMLAWFEERLGPAGTPIRPQAGFPGATPGRALPGFPAEVSHDPEDRFRHARGQGLADIIRLRSGTALRLPDAVVRPACADEVGGVLAAAARAGVAVIPWGGGTSVTGGVNPPEGDRPVLALDLERLSGLVDLDETSGLATFGPGTTGPAVEAALEGHGLTLGHYPQSWELSTVGGWIATRSSGQESRGYGRIEDMVAGMEVTTPGSLWSLPALPASAAGPDLRELVMGSEGRLGVITAASLRVRPRPEASVVEASLVPDLDRGLEAVRTLVRSGMPLSMIRLSDAAETQVALAIGLAAQRAAPLVRAYLRLRGIGADACLLLMGSAGHRRAVADVLEMARLQLREAGAVSLGRGPGRQWQRDRFRHPYLREALLDRGWATDTLETAVPWSRTTATREAIRSALEEALASVGERVAVLCHVSHPYTDGTSLYFTFFFRCAADPEETIARWARAKRAATQTLASEGATLSHHHGIGSWHAPWLDAEIGQAGRLALEAAAAALDPDGTLNPHVLLDPTDRLEA